MKQTAFLRCLLTENKGLVG